MQSQRHIMGVKWYMIRPPRETTKLSDLPSLNAIRCLQHYGVTFLVLEALHLSTETFTGGPDPSCCRLETFTGSSAQELAPAGIEEDTGLSLSACRFACLDCSLRRSLRLQPSVGQEQQIVSK